MGKSISLDIAALILLIVLTASRISRKMTHDRASRIVLFIMFTAITSAAFDITAVILDNTQNQSVPLLYIAHAGYLITHVLSVPLYLLFIISLTDTWHKLQKNIPVVLLLILPLAAVLAAFFVNLFKPVVFSVENGYTRGPLFGIMYVTAILYVIYVISYIVRYRKLFDRGNIIAVSLIIPIDVAAMLIQYLMPNVLIETFGGAIGLLIMITSLQRPEDYIDSFTHLMKHSTYAHDMKRAFYNDKHVYIIMLNIANFQKIQAIIGFNCATEVLENVADTIRQINRRMRGYADLYYLDNGRFRMVFREKNQDKTKDMADILNHELKKPINIKGLNITLTPFIILAHCPEEIKSFKALMSFGSDFHVRNIYTGKVMLASQLYNENELDIQNNIDSIIEQALENESFQVYYQPIYSIKQNRFISAEALLRLYDSKRGFISPETLVTAAEDSGAIHRIGAFVFEKVCQFIASEEFQKLGLDYIEVNLSVVQIMNADLPDNLLSIMSKYNISPDKINLEITESATAYNQQKVMIENFERLTQAGLSFSLDDYGTGYSNIKRMIHLPLKIIKLDKSFADEKDNPKMWIIIKNTIKMLKDMNMEIVVEGVETSKGLDIFSELQCDFIQGYYFSKPIPRKEFVAFIANANQTSTATEAATTG